MRARFFAPVQTGSGVHPASYTMGTGSFPGVKRPGRGADHPPPSSAEVEGRVELYIFPPRPSWPVLGKLYLYLYFKMSVVVITDDAVQNRSEPVVGVVLRDM